jgi:hypothetical protein
MIPIKQTVINIEPQTNVRSTQGDRWLFAVTDDYLEEYDKRKALDHPKGIPGRNLPRKRQLEKYNAYKAELLWMAHKHGFKMPHGHFALWFYVPHPPSWRPKKVAEMLYKPHQTTPDWDNFIKALFDSLMPRKKRSRGEKGSQDDRLIHCGAIFKVWVLPGEACIKVLEYPDGEFLNEFRHGHPSYDPESDKIKRPL